MPIPPIRMDDRVSPWEMQPSEGSAPFYAFTLYRDMGPTRSLRKLAVQMCEEEDDFAVLSRVDKATRIALKASGLEKYSIDNNWQARCKAYDFAMDREATAARLEGRKKAIQEASRRHANLALATIGVAMKWLEKFHDPRDDKFRNTRIEEMTIGEVLNAGKTGTTMERLALGMDTEDEAQANSDRLEGRTVSTPDQLKRIAREAAAEAISAEPSPEIVIEPPKE